MTDSLILLIMRISKSSVNAHYLFWGVTCVHVCDAGGR